MPTTVPTHGLSTRTGPVVPRRAGCGGRRWRWPRRFPPCRTPARRPPLAPRLRGTPARAPRRVTPEPTAGPRRRRPHSPLRNAAGPTRRRSRGSCRGSRWCGPAGGAAREGARDEAGAAPQPAALRTLRTPNSPSTTRSRISSVLRLAAIAAGSGRAGPAQARPHRPAAHKMAAPPAPLLARSGATPAESSRPRPPPPPSSAARRAGRYVRAGRRQERPRRVGRL